MHGRGRFIHLPVDARDFIHEPLAIAVLQVQDVRERPMKVIGDEGYLLEKGIEGVAYDSPGPVASTWNVWLQLGQVTVICGLPLPLMVR